MDPTIEGESDDVTMEGPHIASLELIFENIASIFRCIILPQPQTNDPRPIHRIRIPTKKVLGQRNGRLEEF
jgi:hypothetical protein